jgi:aspartyl/asparaginyl-tRNA synthetase
MLFRRFASTASRRLPPTIRQLLAQEPDPQTTLSVTGHIRSIRKQKRVAFAAVNDGSCPEGLQAVLSPDDAHAFVHSLLDVAFADTLNQVDERVQRPPYRQVRAEPRKRTGERVASG